MNTEKLILLEQVFSPSAPIVKRDLFFGRMEQVDKIVQTINERGKHAVLYGERGVGKTSLANILTEIFPQVICSKVTCNRTENFNSIWRKALKNIKFISETQGIGFTAATIREIQQLDLFIPETEELDSSHLSHVLRNLKNLLLFIFDEFDSVSNSETKVKMADTIKSLSDNIPNVTTIIVGIADSVKELVGEHPSLERCLAQIKMPRMSDSEIKEIVVNGMNKLELTFSDFFLKKVIEYSAGFPHYTHLLSKYAALHCIKNDRTELTRGDFNKAVMQSIDNSNESIRQSFQKATISAKGKTKFEYVIAACAMAKINEYNCFSINEVLAKYNEITKKKFIRQSITYNLNMLCKEEKGSILEKIGTSKNIMYRFRNPLMLAFVKLKSYAKEELPLISD